MDAGRESLTVGGRSCPTPARQGRQQIAFYLDRTTLEIFTSGGLVYVPLPVIADPLNRRVTVSVRGGRVEFSRLDAYRLRSMWSSP